MQLPAASNRQQTLLRKLNRKKYRYKESLFMLEGERAVDQVLENNNLSVTSLFFDESQQLWLHPEWQQKVQQHEAAVLDTGLFREVTDTVNPQGVLALCQMPEEQTAGAMAVGEGLLVALDALQDPGNLGTIVRTASWFDCRGIISGKGTVDLFHPKVVRSTAGATGSMPHLNGDLAQLLPQFEEAGWQVLLLDASADAVPLPEVQKGDKTVLVTGNEARGIRPELFAEGRTSVMITTPSVRPDVESLNAAIATSVALYELSGKQH